MYSISWSKEPVGPWDIRTVQYLPEIESVLRDAFGLDGAVFIHIIKESND
jgi:hypothetical protein